MNLKSLSQQAVQKTGRVEKVAGLSGAELKAVVAGVPQTGIVGQDTPTPREHQPVQQGPVTAEQCAIHFYYPQDAAS
jgi:hypothetical protein